VTKFSILASLAVIVLLLAIPAVVLAQAQPPLPSVFVGTVSFDGAPAADGTVVSALIEGELVASNEAENGVYFLRIPQTPGSSFAGKVIVFKVGGSEAAEKHAWEADGGGELNLTAITPPAPATATPIPPGRAGADGKDGAVGASGANGKDGAVGASGSAGAKGKDGAAGKSGSAGAKGGSGPAGSAGAKGDTGPVGAAGAAGPAGAAGGGGSLGMIALIIAIVAAIGAGGAFVMGRRS